MKNQTTLFGPFNQIITMDKVGSAGPLSDDDLEVVSAGGIVVENGQIRAVGSYDTLACQHDNIVSFSGEVTAVPGFIDAHTHICWAGSRAKDYALRLEGFSYQEIAAKGGGILDTVRNTRKASKEDLVDVMHTRLKALRSRGITTCEVKSGYGLTVDDELKMLEAIQTVNADQDIDIIPTCLAAHKRPWEFDTNEEYLNHLIEHLLPQVITRDLSNRVDIFVEAGAFTPQEAKTYLTKAREMGFMACVHADQFSRGGSLLASDIHALSADHLEVSEEEDFTAMKGSGVIPIVLPGASIGLGIPFAPARRILDAGLPLVIASDWNPGSAPHGDLLTQAAIMGASEKLSMAETLRAITSNAAKALNLNDRGIIREGMRADFIIFPSADHRDILYYQGSMKPSHSIIRGKLTAL